MPSATAAEKQLSARGQYFVFFLPDSAEITPAAKVILDKAAEDAVRAGAARITVRGYAAGHEGDPPAIAAERAATVAKALVENGAGDDEVRTQIVGLAPQPAPDVSPEMDRRVEILLEPRHPSYSAVRGSGLPWVATLR